MFKSVNQKVINLWLSLKIRSYAFWLFFLSMFSFPVFLWQMVIMGFQLWKNKATLRPSQVLPMIVVHFNPKLTNPSQIVGQLDKAVSEPFTKLHGYPPIVLCMPIGMTISSLSFESFLEIMNKEQLKLFKQALYRKTNNIEIVKNIDEEIAVGQE